MVTNVEASTFSLVGLPESNPPSHSISGHYACHDIYDFFYQGSVYCPVSEGELTEAMDDYFAQEQGFYFHNSVITQTELIEIMDGYFS